MTKARDIFRSPRALLLLGMVGLVLSYALATRAIDTGSLGQYGLTILVFALSIRLFTRAINAMRNDNK